MRYLRRSTLLACVAALGASAVVPSSVSQLARLVLDPPAAHNVAVGGVPVKPIEQGEAARLALRGSSTVDWPGAGSADVDVTAGKDARAGNLPIWVGKRDGQVRVELLDRAATEKAGVHGVAFRVSGDGGPLSVGLDYSGFRRAFGGDWATRLQLVRVSDGTVVPSRNDSTAGKLTADVELPGSSDSTVAQGAAPGGVLFALVAAAASGDGQGDYSATPLAPSASWQVSQQTGDFNWTYPLKVPAVPGGLQPQFALSYSSSRIDGHTASTNNQPSWIGEGWDMSSGHVERRFTSCAENTEVIADKTADKCWFDENASIVLGGQSSQIVKDKDSGALRLKNDDGSKIERRTGAANGDVDGEYWVVTKTDGTQYHFGRNKLDGWAQGNPETNSAWTVPVFERRAGQPCNKPAFKDSWCDRVWKWNLDYVVDKYGNSMTYYYDAEVNFYGRHRNDAAARYIRGGTLNRVEYGTRKGHEYEGAPAKISFETAERCVSGSACGTADYPDVPFDQKCDGGTCPDRISASFWSTKKLSKVVTRAKKTDGGWQEVDSWSLGHDFPSTEDSSSPALWLKGITHAGHAGGNTIPLPEVTFDGKRLANRVGGAAGYGGYLPLYKFRLTDVYSESGGRINLDYHDGDCERNSRLPDKNALDENRLRCYPVTWAPPNRPEAVDWFHKYVVRAVSETDRTGGAPDQKTNYDYIGDPAWHYTDDEITPERLRTWSEWRGYARVKVTKAGTRTERLFYRGMNGDRKQSDGTAKSVKLKDSENPEFDDIPAAQGFQREEIVLGPDDTALIKTITKPVPLGPFARKGSLEAWMLRSGETRTFTKLSSGTTRTTTSTPKYHDQYGVVLEVDDRGDDTTADDDLCVKSTYGNRDDLWLRNLLVSTETWGKDCTGTATVEQVLKKNRTYYDGSPDLGVIPGLGNATKSEQAAYVENGAHVFRQTSRAAFDDYGRVTESYDALDRKSTTSYTHTHGLLTGQTMTNAKNYSASVKLDPVLGQPIEKTDVNNGVTRLEYDALGRLFKVYEPGRVPGTHSPTAQFEYLVRKDKVTAVSTTTLGSTGNKVTAWAIYDGLLRPRQTQAEAPYTGRQLTDTFYNDRGLVERTASLYYNKDSLPSSELVVPPNGNEVALPSQTVTSYDVLGRAVSQKFIGLGQDKWTSTTVYGGDRIMTTPPPGGTATTVLSDARGRTTELRQHKQPTPTGDYDATRYGYSRSGELETVTDPAGNVWRNTYDLRGRKTGSDDPDRGHTTSAYDDAGQLTSTTDSRGKTVRFEYDVLGRKTGSFEGSAQLAGWTYDTVAKGLPTASIRYAGGQEYRSEVTAYDVAGRATASKVVIPGVEGALAGTYETRTKYGQDGSVSTVDLPKAGDLPAEKLQYLYTKTGQADYLGGTTPYVEKATYNEYSQLSQLHLDTGIQNKTKWVQLNYTYEADTRRLSTADILRRASTNTVPSKAQYNYDAVGNVKSVIEAPTSFKTDADGNVVTLPNNDPSSVDYQCFQYDHVRQLTEAWAGTSKCAAAPSQAVVGGPAGYWQSFRYDKAGNRTKEIDHAAAGDTTSDYVYPQSGGHLLRSVTSTGPSGQQLSEFDYDSTGNMTRRMVSGTTHTMDWNAEGQMVSDKATGQDTSYIYDADGNRLLRKAPGATTLYLGMQEMLLVSGSTAPRGTRYYALGGQTVAVRTAAGISWQFSDHQGTQQVSLAVSTLAVTQRRQTPFGESRGAAPASWPDDKGFVGGVQEASGLTRLGARDYDSATGRFISADPVMVLDDPQQINGYAYANSSPLTYSDPTGLKREDDHPICVGIYGDCGIDSTTREGSSIYGEYTPEQLSGMGVLRSPQQRQLEAAGIPDANYRRAQELEKQSWVDVALQAGGEILKELLGINDMQKCFGEGDFGACAQMVLGVIPWGKILKAGKIVKALDNAFTAVKSFLKQQEWAKGLLAKARDVLGGCNKKNSFTPDTQVVMADGKRKPIAAIRVGDKVLATDPETGESKTKTVANLIIGAGKKNLVEITVDTDGKTGSATGKVTATDGHPFWLPDKGVWVKATELREGAWLRTSAGTWVQVAAVRKWTAYERVYNLTVADIHTYFVVAGTQPVLSHNCGDLYRSDTRDPDEIFEKGFEPLGDNMNLEEHVAGVSGKYTDPSGYVATTTSKSHAMSRGNNVYVIRNVKGVDVNKTLPDGRHKYEHEIAVPGAIDRSCIVGCYVGGKDWVPNPHFKG
ncbi:polymorphic toxin-type HINT domain-containing protein [Lentzea sp. NPDC051838]|uniref:polymorphic toxin-type HINT domain-containing protein n=1 Tax=Lentzea sp. NPDC051838 TaxID=3154849 RepID=UPI00342E83FB